MSLIPDGSLRKISQLVHVSHQAVIFGMIPLLGLLFTLRLVEWYIWRYRFPCLGVDNTPMARDFRAALPRLWFAALFWPIIIAMAALILLR